MERLINETLQIARERFAAFGFKEEQIQKLLESGKQDLEKEIRKLNSLIEEENLDINLLNQTLHALKGLLYNMGNTKAGDIMTDLKNETGDKECIAKIKREIG
jgi:hypothetical protein